MTLSELYANLAQLDAAHALVQQQYEAARRQLQSAITAAENAERAEALRRRMRTWDPRIVEAVRTKTIPREVRGTLVRMRLLFKVSSCRYMDEYRWTEDGLFAHNLLTQDAP